MKHHLAGVIESQVRGAAHGLPSDAVKALEAKAKIPDQKAFLALRHAPGHDEMRLIQRLEHVRKNALHRGHALDLVERVFEKGLGGIKVFEPGHIGALELLKKLHQGIDGAVQVGLYRAHVRSLTMRLTSGK